MKKYLALGVAVVFAMVATVRAEDLTSGPQVGEKVGAFEVTKAAGAANDGVPVGMDLCYRCKLGQAPVVMVFARQPNENLAKLTKQLDAVVAKNTEKKMGSFVNLLGANADDLKKQAETFVTDHKIKNIAFVVPADQPNGPAEYKISDKADVTVLIYRQGTVAANYALPTGGLNDEAIEKIVNDTSKILD